MRRFAVAVGILIASLTVKAQILPGEINGRDGQPLKYAMPILTVSPDSRASGMGDVGVATSPDANSQHWNPAKFVFIENNMGMSISYTPWLSNLTDDMNLSYISGYKKLDNKQSISFSFMFFSLGSMEFRDENNLPIASFNPNEFSLDAAYSRKLSDYIAGSITFRYIYSNLTGTLVETMSTGHSVAADISMFYSQPIKIQNNNSNIAAGLSISNLGDKMAYSNEESFLPTNLRLGSAFTYEMDTYNDIAFALDFNKLLVPTTPIYDNDGLIVDGFNPNVNVLQGLFQSFYDAPGGFSEEIAEVTISAGVEYKYYKQFAARLGYFHEDTYKGNRKYFTFGAGLKYNVFTLDFSYLVPTAGNTNPLANTMRFSLTFDFDEYKKAKR